MEMFSHHNFDRNLEQIVKLAIQCYIFWRTIIRVGANKKEDKIFFWPATLCSIQLPFQIKWFAFCTWKIFSNLNNWSLFRGRFGIKLYFMTGRFCWNPDILPFENSILQLAVLCYMGPHNKYKLYLENEYMKMCELYFRGGKGVKNNSQSERLFSILRPLSRLCREPLCGKSWVSRLASFPELQSKYARLSKNIFGE